MCWHTNCCTWISLMLFCRCFLKGIIQSSVMILWTALLETTVWRFERLFHGHSSSSWSTGSSPLPNLISLLGPKTCTYYIWRISVSYVECIYMLVNVVWTYMCLDFLQFMLYWKICFCKYQYSVLAVFLTHIGIQKMLTWLPMWKAKLLYHVGKKCKRFFLPLQKFKTIEIEPEKNPYTQASMCLLHISRSFKDNFKYIYFTL